MKADRINTVGIKQIIRLEWLEQAVNLVFSGLPAKDIRHELHEYLKDRKGDGSTETRGDTARGQIVNIIMKIWVSPDVDMVQFRDSGLGLLRQCGTRCVPVHWAAVSAAYPFWFNVARQVGRLIALQGQVQKLQIDKRLKEQYGDRETVSRYGRQVIRSFVAWEVLCDTTVAGCYEGPIPIPVSEIGVIAYLVESALLSSTENKFDLTGLYATPAFFPFGFLRVSGTQLKNQNPRLDVHRFAAGDEVVGLIS
jgi:hypothetical protein